RAPRAEPRATRARTLALRGRRPLVRHARVYYRTVGTEPYPQRTAIRPRCGPLGAHSFQTQRNGARCAAPAHWRVPGCGGTPATGPDRPGGRPRPAPRARALADLSTRPGLWC